MNDELSLQAKRCELKLRTALMSRSLNSPSDLSSPKSVFMAKKSH
jgi:hypothetical protein